MFIAFVVVSSLIFGCLGLSFLSEAFSTAREAARRRKLTEEERAAEDVWALGGSFNLRREGSELRSRHIFKEVPKGRTAELNQPQRDPYAP